MNNNYENNNAFSVEVCPPKKKSKKKLFVILPLVAALLTLITIAVVLMVPMFSNPWKKTLDSFVDSDSIGAFVKALRDTGTGIDAQINLPNEDYTITLTGTSVPEGDVRSNNTIGMYELDFGDGTKESNKSRVKLGWNSEKFVLGFENKSASRTVEIPRVNVEKELEESIFHPKSGTSYALSESDYEKLLNTLLEFQPNDLDAEIAKTESLERSYKAILVEWMKIARPQKEYKLFDGGFYITQNITYKLDTDTVCDMIDVVLDEVENNENIKDLIPLSSMETIFGISFGEDAYDTVGFLKKMKEKSYDIELSYIVRGDTLFELEYDILYADGRLEYKYSGSFIFEYCSNASSIIAEHEYTAHKKNEKLSFVFDKYFNEEGDATCFVLDADYNGTKHNCTLNLYPDTKRYALNYTGEEDSFAAEGGVDFDLNECKLSLSLDKITTAGVTVTKDDSYFMSMKIFKSNEVPDIPSGKPLLDMYRSEMDKLLNELISLFQ